MDEPIWMYVKKIREESYMIMSVRLCIKKEFCSVLCVCAPRMEISEEERIKGVYRSMLR